MNATDFLAEFAAVQTFDPEAPRGPAPARLVGVFDGAVAENWDAPAIKGRVVMVNLWATWCAPCITELPTIRALQQAREGDGTRFRVLTLSNDFNPKPDALAKVLQAAGFAPTPGHYHLDPADKAGWGGYIGVALPTTFIIAPDGQLLYKLTGAADWGSPGALDFIDGVLKD